MASNPYVNKVEFGNQTVMDITDTTAEAADVASGEVFYNRSGARTVGTGDYYSPNDTAETTIDDTDYFPFYDTSATAKRKTLWSNIKAKLKAYFDTIYQAVLSFDTWPTSGSSNPVTSNGIASALTTKMDRLETDVLGAKNLLPMAVTRTISGVTFTVEEDGRVNFSGTNSSSDKIYFPIYPADGSYVSSGFANYILSGCMYGSESTFYLCLLTSTDETTISSEYPVYGGDQLTIPLLFGKKRFAICVCGNQTVNNAILPMLRLGRDPYDNYVPYAMTNRELTIAQPTLFPRAEQQVLGARNLCESRCPTSSINGITFTKNTDGSYTISGVNNGTGQSVIRIDQSTRGGNDNLKGYHGRYTLSLLDSDGNYVSNTGIILMQESTYYSSLEGKASNLGVATGNVDKDNNFIYIYVPVSSNFSTPKTVYPMLRLATDPDPSYTQYAMTNKQITDALTKGSYTTSGLTPTGCSIVTGGYYKLGRIVIVNIRIKASGTSSVITVSGFPTYSGITTTNMVGVSGNATNNNKPPSAYIGATGVLTVQHEGMAADVGYLLSTIYLCD